jgi:hypothetical protein
MYISAAGGFRMTKNPKKKAPKKKPRRAKARGPRTLRIRISESETTRQDIERAIKKKLATQPTDLFRSNDTLIIVVEEFRI